MNAILPMEDEMIDFEEGEKISYLQLQPTYLGAPNELFLSELMHQIRMNRKLLFFKTDLALLA